MSLGGSIIHRQVKADTTDDSRVLVTAGRVREMLSFNGKKNKTTTSSPWISGGDVPKLMENMGEFLIVFTFLGIIF